MHTLILEFKFWGVSAIAVGAPIVSALFAKGVGKVIGTDVKLMFWRD